MKFNFFQKIDTKKLIDFIYDILFNEDQFEIDKEIKETFLNYLKENKKNFINNHFIFENNSNLENLVVIVYASFLINLPVCIIGPKGIGKSSFLHFIVEILKEQQEIIFHPYYKHINSESINQEIIRENYNLLIKSAKEGCIFLAEETDISSNSTTSSLLPLLDPLLNSNIIIPEINQPININKNFYLMASMTHVEINYFQSIIIKHIIPKEEKDIFKKIKKIIKIIKYPQLNEKKITDIFIKKSYNIKGELMITNEEKKFLLKFLFNYNNIIEENLIDLKHWSFRDIDKLLNHLNYNSYRNKFLNFQSYHFIYFYFFSSIPRNELKKEYKYYNKKKQLKIILHNIFTELFKLDKLASKNLENSFFSKPKIDKKNNCIMKGEVGLKLSNDLLKIMEQSNDENENLSDIYDDYFKLNLFSHKEAIILIGSSRYKLELLKLYINNNNLKIIYCNQESEINYLLNLRKDSSDDESEAFELIDNKKIDYKKMILLSHNYPIILELLNNTLKQVNINNEAKFLVKKSSILWYLFREESIIFKDIHLFPFAKSKSFDLLIYINNWFLKNFSLGINLIGISPEISLKDNDNTFLSEFILFYVQEHDFETNIKIFKKFTCLLSIQDEYIVHIISLYKSQKLENINQLKNFANILSKMNENNKEFKLNYDYLISLFFNKKKTEIEKEYKINKSILYKSDNFIFSSVSKLKNTIFKFNKNDSLFLEKNLIFTGLFNKFLDLIHMVISTDIPLILEGYPEEGRNLAIKYIGYLLNYKIKNIYITTYFSLNDLKKMINIDEENIENTILIFHNINNANLDILSEITEIFNNIDKKKQILIGIINRNDKSNEESKYEQYFKNSIYYKVSYLQHYHNVNEVISHIRELDSSVILKYNKIGNLFSLYDMDKCIRLKKYFGLNDKYIRDIILKKNKLPFLNDKFNISPYDSLKWVFKDSINKEATIQINDESLIFSSQNYVDLEKSLNTLSQEQKRCFIFLILSYISNNHCIVQGPTGVGKSYLILILSKILGKKLYVFQLNKDNNNYKLYNQLYLRKNANIDKKEIFLRLQEIKGSQIDYESKGNGVKSELIINQRINSKYILKQNFERKDSSFLEAIKNGDWILLDGIENCLNFVSNIIEILYPVNGFISHKDFRLFITFNTTNIKELPNNIIEKCLVYNLKSFVDNKNSVKEIFNGYLKNLNFFKDDKYISDLSLKLANIHMILLGKIDTNSNNKITERTLINFCETLSIKTEENHSLNHYLIEQFLYHYFPCCNDEKKNFEFIEIIRENLKSSDPLDNQQNKNIIVSSNKIKEIEKFCHFDVGGGGTVFFHSSLIKNLSMGKDGVKFRLNEEKEDETKIKKTRHLQNKIIEALDSDKDEHNFIVSIEDEPNKKFLLKKIKINFIDNELSIVEEIERVMLLNSVYINQILGYYIENKNSKEDFLCIIMENNKNVKTLLKNQIPINLLWTIFFRAIAGIMSLESQNLKIKNFDLKYLYIDDNNNVKFDVTIFISKYFYQYNILDLDDETPMNSLRIQLFKDNKINSLEELIYGNFLINLMYVVLYEENIELIIFYFNSLKYFFKDYDLEDVFFDLSDLTCGNCKILLEIYLKDKKTLLTRCNNCYAVKNIKLEIFRDNIVPKKISVKKILAIKDDKKYSKYLNEFPNNLGNKYQFVKTIIDNLLEKYKDDDLRKDIFNDRIINILKIYINDLIILSNLVHLFLNVFFMIQSNNVLPNLISQYKTLLLIIHEYFSEKKTKKFQKKIETEKDNFLILYNNIFQNEINELKIITNDFFKPIVSNISDFDKTKQYIEKILLYSHILNKYITIEKIKNPEKYINANDLLKNIENITAKSYDSRNRNFILAILAKCIENNGIKINISKNEDQHLNDIELVSIQSLLSLGNQIKYVFYFDFGKTTNNRLMKELNFRNNFIKNLKTKIAKKINIKEENLIMQNFHDDSIAIHIYPLYSSYETEKSLKSLINDREFQITKIVEKPLLDALEISPKIFNPLGDRYTGWGKNEKRGGEDYIPPGDDWFGIGLNVMGKYDNGNNSWIDYKNLEGEFAIAYLGFNNFLNNNAHISNKLNVNNLTQNLFEIREKKLYINQKNQRDKSFFKGKCGDGICVFQNLQDAENFAGIIDINQKMVIKIVFMCRVNTNKVRQPKNYSKFWIVNPTPDEIRPYRILIKKIPISSLIGTLNDTLITTSYPMKYIISAIESKDNSFYSIVNQYPKYIQFNNQKLNDDFAVIRFYAGEFYIYLNNYLRNENKVDFFTEKNLASWVYCLHLALQRNINVSDGTIVYRGVNKKFPPEINEGSRFFFREFVSCTTSLNQAKDFAGHSGTIIIIKIKNNGTNGKNYCFSLKDISLVPEEEEILITSHCYYIVDKIEKDNGLDHYYLTCEGYNDSIIQDGEIKIIK